MRYNYNLSGSGRKPLVEAISQMLDKPAIYQGAPNFSYIVGDYTIDRNGVLFCKDDANPEIVNTLVEALQERGFIAENVSDAADEETTEENGNDTDEADTESPNILTIEIPDAGFTPEAKENLKRIVASKKTVLEKALEADGLPIVEKDGKIAFPWFTLHGLDGEADAYSRLIDAICKMAKEQKRVTATEKPVENGKYEMRLFLIRLGFIGDKYKAARKILLRNLSGNSSWKSGHKPEQNTNAIIQPNSAEAALPSAQELVAPLEEMDIVETEAQKEDEGGELYDK